MKSEAGRFFSSLREKLPGLRAFVLLSPEGEPLGHAAVDPGFDPQAFAAEYATLLRIAQHTLDETGMGDLQEQVLTSVTSLIVIRRFPRDRFGVFVCSPEEHLGRLRYELKRCLLYSSLSNL